MLTARAPTRLFVFLGVTFLIVLAWSAIGPKDRTVWWLEVLPAIVGVAVLLATYRRFPLTPLLYVLIWLHALILLVGGHYTYAEVPLFDTIRDVLHLGRNHYDRVGHFMQGFVPAMIAREILLRATPLRPGGMLFFLCTCVALAISAFYEMIEWWVAVVSGTGADAFLGTQGDVWDTQWDMFLALIGAVTSQLALGWLQDGQLRGMPIVVEGTALSEKDTASRAPDRRA
jgi:putative membrane protein